MTNSKKAIRVRSILFAAVLPASFLMACGDKAAQDTVTMSLKRDSAAASSTTSDTVMDDGVATQARVFSNDASKEADVIAEMFGCELKEGARENSMVCLLMEKRFYVGIISNGDGTLNEVIVAAVSEDAWSSELPHFEQAMQRYYSMDVSEIKNIYPSLNDSDPNIRAGTEMALNSMFSLHNQLSDSEISIPPDTQYPWIAFSFNFE